MKLPALFASLSFGLCLLAGLAPAVAQQADFGRAFLSGTGRDAPKTTVQQQLGRPRAAAKR